MKMLASNCGNTHDDQIANQVRIMGFDARSGAFSLQTQKKTQTIYTKNKNPTDPTRSAQLRLILPDHTAIGIGLRHASQASPANKGMRRTAQ